MSRTSENELRAAFQEMDTSNNGTVDRSKFEFMLCKKLGIMVCT